MPRTSRSILSVLALAALMVTACGQAAVTAPEADGPAKVEPIDGTPLKRLTLTEEATRRLGIETVRVASGPGGRTTVPAATVLYDASGLTWVYTNPQAHVFVRAEITVARIDSGVATLTSGPPTDTPVVTVGVAELYGTELGVGDPE